MDANQLDVLTFIIYIKSNYWLSKNSIIALKFTLDSSVNLQENICILDKRIRFFYQMCDCCLVIDRLNLRLVKFVVLCLEYTLCIFYML